MTRTEFLIKEFRGYLKKDENDIGFIYHRIFSMCDDNTLGIVLDRMYDSFMGEKDYWFYEFHKSIRQTDFLEGLYQITNVDNRTEEQKSRQDELYKSLRAKYDARPDKDGKYISLRAFSYEHGLKEEWDEWAKLSQISQGEVKESISGAIDAILHTIINMDVDGVLERLLRITFRMYQAEVEDKIIKE